MKSTAGGCAAFATAPTMCNPEAPPVMFDAHPRDSGLPRPLKKAAYMEELGSGEFLGNYVRITTRVDDCPYVLEIHSRHVVEEGNSAKPGTFPDVWGNGKKLGLVTQDSLVYYSSSNPTEEATLPQLGQPMEADMIGSEQDVVVVAHRNTRSVEEMKAAFQYWRHSIHPKHVPAEGVIDKPDYQTEAALVGSCGKLGHGWIANGVQLFSVAAPIERGWSGAGVYLYPEEGKPLSYIGWIYGFGNTEDSFNIAVGFTTELLEQLQANIRNGASLDFPTDPVNFILPKAELPDLEGWNNEDLPGGVDFEVAVRRPFAAWQEPEYRDSKAYAEYMAYISSLTSAPCKECGSRVDGFQSVVENRGEHVLQHQPTCSSCSGGGPPPGETEKEDAPCKTGLNRTRAKCPAPCFSGGFVRVPATGPRWPEVPEWSIRKYQMQEEARP